MAIPSVPIFADIAKSSGKQLLSVSLKGKQHAEVLFNDKAMDAFILEGDKIVGGSGFRTAKADKYQSNMIKLFNQLGKLGADLQELVVKHASKI